MTQNNSNNPEKQPGGVFEIKQQTKHAHQRKRRLFMIGLVLLVLIILAIIPLVLALTVSKVRQPVTQVISASIDGVSPRISFPLVRIELNVTFSLRIMVKNRNHASFNHGSGKSMLFYKGKQVGEADVYPGLIPAMGSSEVPCRLTVEVDELAEQMADLIHDVLAGEVVMETVTRVPGRVKFMGIFRKHVVAVSECQMTVGIPFMKILKQDCKQNIKM